MYFGKIGLFDNSQSLGWTEFPWGKFRKKSTIKQKITKNKKTSWKNKKQHEKTKQKTKQNKSKKETCKTKLNKQKKNMQ